MIASWSGVSVMGSALPGGGSSEATSTEAAIVTAGQQRRRTTGGYLRFIARTMSAERTPFPTAAIGLSLAGCPGGNIGRNPEAPDWHFRRGQHSAPGSVAVMGVLTPRPLQLTFMPGQERNRRLALRGDPFSTHRSSPRPLRTPPHIRALWRALLEMPANVAVARGTRSSFRHQTDFALHR